LPTKAIATITFLWFPPDKDDTNLCYWLVSPSLEIVSSMI